jgi:hypothetical protein
MLGSKKIIQRNEASQRQQESGGEGSTWGYEKYLSGKKARMKKITVDPARQRAILAAFGTPERKARKSMRTYLDLAKAAEPYKCRMCGHETWNLGGKKRHEAETGHRKGWGGGLIITQEPTKPNPQQAEDRIHRFKKANPPGWQTGSSAYGSEMKLPGIHWSAKANVGAERARAVGQKNRSGVRGVVGKIKRKVRAFMTTKSALGIDPVARWQSNFVKGAPMRMDGPRHRRITEQVRSYMRRRGGISHWDAKMIALQPARERAKTLRSYGPTNRKMGLFQSEARSPYLDLVKAKKFGKFGGYSNPGAAKAALTAQTRRVGAGPVKKPKTSYTAQSGRTFGNPGAMRAYEAGQKRRAGTPAIASPTAPPKPPAPPGISGGSGTATASSHPGGPISGRLSGGGTKPSAHAMPTPKTSMPSTPSLWQKKPPTAAASGAPKAAQSKFVLPPARQKKVYTGENWRARIKSKPGIAARIGGKLGFKPEDHLWSPAGRAVGKMTRKIKAGFSAFKTAKSLIDPALVGILSKAGKRQAKKNARKRFGGVVSPRQVRGTHADTGGGLRYKRRMRRQGIESRYGLGYNARDIATVSHEGQVARKSAYQDLLGKAAGKSKRVDPFRKYGGPGGYGSGNTPSYTPPPGSSQWKKPKLSMKRRREQARQRALTNAREYRPATAGYEKSAYQDLLRKARWALPEKFAHAYIKDYKTQTPEERTRWRHPDAMIPELQQAIGHRSKRARAMREKRIQAQNLPSAVRERAARRLGKSLRPKGAGTHPLHAQLTAHHYEHVGTQTKAFYKDDPHKGSHIYDAGEGWAIHTHPKTERWTLYRDANGANYASGKTHKSLGKYLKHAKQHGHMDTMRYWRSEEAGKPAPWNKSTYRDLLRKAGAAKVSHPLGKLFSAIGYRSGGRQRRVFHSGDIHGAGAHIFNRGYYSIHSHAQSGGWTLYDNRTGAGVDGGESHRSLRRYLRQSKQIPPDLVGKRFAKSMRKARRPLLVEILSKARMSSKKCSKTTASGHPCEFLAGHKGEHGAPGRIASQARLAIMGRSKRPKRRRPAGMTATGRMTMREHREIMETR